MPRARKTNTRKVRERILILCEGAKTEPNYFNGIRADKSQENQLTGLRIQVFDTKYNTAVELVKESIDLKKEAVKERNPYDSVWVVVDKDYYHKHPEAYDLAEKNNIQIAFSSISFEYWFLLHFGRFNISFNRSRDLERYLRDQNHYRAYKKSHNHYDTLRPKTYKAIANAKWLRKEIQYDESIRPYHYNPFTNVDILVEYLLNL